MNNSVQTKNKAVESLTCSGTHLGDSIKDELALSTQSFAQDSSVTYERPIYNLSPPWIIQFQQAVSNKVARELRNKTKF